MTNKRSKNQNRRSNKNRAVFYSGKPREIDPTCLECPASYAQAVKSYGHSELDLHTTTLIVDTALTSDGSGLIHSVFSDNPNGVANWTSFVSVFSEYRILCFQIEFDPLWAAGGSTSLFWAPIAHVVDNDDSTALTAYSVAARYSSCTKSPGQRRFTHTAMMEGSSEAAFQPTASPAATKWIKFYSSGNTVSTTVGRVQSLYVVQFRGKGIT